jgi:hypothetical protein
MVSLRWQVFQKKNCRMAMSCITVRYYRASDRQFRGWFPRSANGYGLPSPPQGIRQDDLFAAVEKGWTGGEKARGGSKDRSPRDRKFARDMAGFPID